MSSEDKLRELITLWEGRIEGKSNTVAGKAQKETLWRCIGEVEEILDSEDK